jgi:ribosomal RNA-processing protein 9
VCRAKPRTVSLDTIAMINEKSYLTGSENGSVSLWSANKKKPVYNIRDAHSGKWITATASLSSTDLVATGSSDGALRLWRVDLEDQYLEEVAHLAVPGFINGLAFGATGKVVVAAVGNEHRLGRWEKMKVKNGLQIVKLPKF